jgi:DUF1680 family protein
MNRAPLLLALSATAGISLSGFAGATEAQNDPVKPVPFTAVHLNDQFWAPRIETNRLFTIPFAFEQCEKSGRMDNFVRAAEALQGKPFANHAPPGYPFDDTDPYKVLEGASYVLAVQPDHQLQAYLDALIAKIAAAQEPDGYLYTARTIDPQHPHAWSGSVRWLRDPDESHELYDSGHLFEAAVAHYQATGKTNLLTVALKNADLLCQVFGPGTNQLHLWPGHEIVEMGLVKLYRATGRQKYLDLAKYFIDVRGSHAGGDEYHQSLIPPVQQREAVGHAVRAAYLYSGMADVAAMTGDATYTRAIDAIWDNAVGKKLYVTGGIGAMPDGEAFGPNYFLPNLNAYCETCAAVGNDYWNARLFLFHADARYVDVFERTLYNGLLSGVSLDGKKFFYPNPLESTGQSERSPWFGCACCPGNITRFLPSLPGYFYAQQGDQLFVNLYASGSAEIRLDNGQTVRVKQTTRYPWDGHIQLTVAPKSAGWFKGSRFTLKLRIPGWARNEAVPGGLYRFADENPEPVTLSVNGRAVPIQLDKGYASLSRQWRKGDRVALDLPMPVRRVLADERVQADRGRVALQRGPIVYCLEWTDNQGPVRNLVLPDLEPLQAVFVQSLLNGVEVIQGRALSLSAGDGDAIVRTPRDFKAIPYYAWANRGRGEMTVWIANSEKSANVLPKPTIASTSKVTLSHPGTHPEAINDQLAPHPSADQKNVFFSGPEITPFHWWPRKGTPEWVQYDFQHPARVSAVEAYWFDDTNKGECRVPQSWRVSYRVNGEWKPVANPSGYTCKTDGFNRTTFAPVETDALRLEIQLQQNWSGGIYEWRVE